MPKDLNFLSSTSVNLRGVDFLKKAIIGILAIIIILISSFYIYRKVDIEQNTKKISMIKNEVVSYLNTKNDCNENMYDLKVEYYFQRKLLGYNPYLIKVTFKDEQNVIYYYDYKNGHISQGGISPMNGKVDKNFKHAEND